MADIGGTLAEREFSKIAQIAYSEAGLVLEPAKRMIVQSRVRRRLSVLGMTNFETYCEFLNSASASSEIPDLITCLTTNVSSFFREAHHFDHLCNQIAPKLLAKMDANQPVRIWSAGCSNGQEPYSIKMALLDVDNRFEDPSCKILATDIDENVLKYAKTGQYTEEQLQGVEDRVRSKYFQKLNDLSYSVTANVRKNIVFNRLNLISEWPMRQKIDVIFCRNVMIYFDQVVQDSLAEKFSNALSDDGTIFVGHSERFKHNVLVPDGNTTYSKRPV
ncbi:MAG: protein-glutamate O-methyltransferase CheR [Paracoccaceae bacterium]